MLRRRDVLLVADLGACGFIERHGIFMLGERLLHPLVLAAPGRNPPIDLMSTGLCLFDSHYRFLSFLDSTTSKYLIASSLTLEMPSSLRSIIAIVYRRSELVLGHA